MNGSPAAFYRLATRYHDNVLVGPYPRLMAWEFLWDWCQSMPTWKALASARNRRTTALQLGLYLANWGMFRGSSGLLQTNLEFFDDLVGELFGGKRIKPKAWSLTLDDFHPESRDPVGARQSFDEIDAVLQSFTRESAVSLSWTPTLRTKVLMGIWGQCPAVDTYFTRGLSGFLRNHPESWTSAGGSLSGQTLTELIAMARRRRWRLEGFRTRRGRAAYPPGKVLDMAFFQYGIDLAPARNT